MSTPLPSKKTVFLAISGGVDSAVSAALLRDQGYQVVCVYMKNWSRDLPGMQCPWAEDLADAKRVAVRLGLDFRIFDFETEYKDKVVNYMLSEFQAGRTPNPDIMCNQEIKFKLFYETARAQGADIIATGHYAQAYNKFTSAAHTDPTLPPPSTPQPPSPSTADTAPLPSLLKSPDQNKDQTYFLYRISTSALSRTLFPVGHLYKPQVKQLAEKYHLPVAHKKESMGICFVGEVGIKDFLQTYLPSTPGEIREAETHRLLGNHEGAVFYTLGQRHGLGLGGGLPYYVVKKDLKANILYASKDLNFRNLWTTELHLTDVILRGLGRELVAPSPAPSPASTSTPASSSSSDAPPTQDNSPTLKIPVEVRLRHRAPLISATLAIPTSAILDNSHLASYFRNPYSTLHPTPQQKDTRLASSVSTPPEDPRLTPHSRDPQPAPSQKNLRSAASSDASRTTTLNSATLHFSTPIKSPAPGQSAVLYWGDICLGGGIIE